MVNKLKTFRKIVAAMVLVVITLLFLGVNFTDKISALLLKVQFVPAMLSFLQGSIIAFILLIIITILFGRIYCSFLCPTGILQDIVGKCSYLFRKKVLKHKIKSSYHKPHNILRYSILIITALFFIAGITTPLIFIDPYSNYGTIASQVFGAIIYHPYVKFSLSGFTWGMAFLIILIIFSALKGRLYCNTICPVGTILGLISGFSLFKPVIKKEMCVKCTACAKVCKSNCIDMESKEIDSTRCVACYNCIPSCKKGGVTIAPIWFNKGDKVVIKRNLENKERRNALIAMGVFSSAMALRGLESKFKIIPKEEEIKKKNFPILPPGAGDLERFKANCTSCHACVAVCPQNIIKPSITQFGLDGFMIPYLDLKGSFCEYSCNKCSQTCPNSAILPLSLLAKQQTKIAKTKYIAKQCIVFSRGKNCGRCARKCPAKAIEMIEVKGKPGLFFPKFIKEKCIGCGACVVVCPPKPKAIEMIGIEEQSTIT